MNEAHRMRIEGALQDINTWRASGMKLAAYAQSRSEALSSSLRQLRVQVVDLIESRVETCPYKRLICCA